MKTIAYVDHPSSYVARADQNLLLIVDKDNFVTINE
jgi:hypothetical protein